MTALIEVANPGLFEAIGVAGFALYVTNYTLLTFHKLDSHATLYFAINLAAAAMVLTGLLVSFNLASALIQAFWLVLSTAAILRRMRVARPAAPVQRPRAARFRSFRRACPADRPTPVRDAIPVGPAADTACPARTAA